MATVPPSFERRRGIPRALGLALIALCLLGPIALPTPPGAPPDPQGGLRASAGIPVAGGGHFPVTFQETGPVNVSQWSVSVDGTVENTTGTSLTVDLANGTYQYSASAVTHPAVFVNGTVTVAGKAVRVPIAWPLPPYGAPASNPGSAQNTLGLGAPLLPFALAGIVIVVIAVLVAALVARRRPTHSPDSPEEIRRRSTIPAPPPGGEASPWAEPDSDPLGHML